MHMVNK